MPIYSFGDSGPQLKKAQARKAMISKSFSASPRDAFAQATGGAPAAGAPGLPGVPASGNLIGAPAFNYAGAYGGIPQIPSPGATQLASIEGNLAAMPQLQALAQQINAFNTQQAVAPFIANLPQYGAMTEASSGNILSNLRGELPPDVMYLIAQQAAERGVQSGVPGSPNANSALLRALGLTSLQRKDLGESQLSGAIARTPIGPLYNPASAFVTPDQQQQAQAAANLYAAAPIPAERAAAELAAAQAGVGAGRGATAPSGYSYPSGASRQTPMAGYRGAGVQPTAPGQPYNPASPNAYAPPPTQAGSMFDPFASTSSRLAESVFSPYMLGGYNYGGSTPDGVGSVPQQIMELAAPLMNPGVTEWSAGPMVNQNAFPGSAGYEGVPGFEGLDDYWDF